MSLNIGKEVAALQRMAGQVRRERLGLVFLERPRVSLAGFGDL